MIADEVIFASKPTKKLAWINICFRFGTIVIIFCLLMWKGVADSEKAKRLSKEEIKKQLLDSMIIDEVTEFQNLNKEAKEVQDLEEAAEIIKRYEEVMKTKKKEIINVAYHQGQLLKSFIGLGFLKNYHKGIKAICKENEKGFRC